MLTYAMTSQIGKFMRKKKRILFLKVEAYDFIIVSFENKESNIIVTKMYCILIPSYISFIISLFSNIRLSRVSQRYIISFASCELDASSRQVQTCLLCVI